jgi:hypothetical protein
MKVKKLTKLEKEQIYNTADLEGFWYALSVGGYINPEDILEDEKDIERVNEAIGVLLELEGIVDNLGVE